MTLLLKWQQAALGFTRHGDKDDSCGVPKWKTHPESSPAAPLLPLIFLHSEPSSHQPALHVPRLLPLVLLLPDIRATLLKGGCIDGWRTEADDVQSGSEEKNAPQNELLAAGSVNSVQPATPGQFISSGLHAAYGGRTK